MRHRGWEPLLPAAALLLLGVALPAACTLDVWGTALGPQGAAAAAGASSTLSSGGGGAGGEHAGGAGHGGSIGGSAPAPECSDGDVQGDEQCDDGNETPADGCTGCLVDEGYECTDEPSICIPIPPQVVTLGPGLGLGITDLINHYDGTLATMDCVSMSVADQGHHITQSVEVVVGAVHSYVGDLIMKLVSPNDAVVLTVFNRPGGTEPSDAYHEDPNGDDSNLAAAYPIRFRDGAPCNAEDMGQGIGDNSVVCKDDGRCDCYPFPGAGPGAAFSDFIGTEAVGSWRACFADGDNGDVGTVDLVTLTVLAW